MADDLRRFLEGEPVRARAPGILKRLAQRRMRSHGRMLMTLSAAIILSIVAYQRFQLLNVRARVGERNTTGSVAGAKEHQALRLAVNRATEAEIRSAVERGDATVHDEPEGVQNLALSYHRLGDLLVNTDRLVDARSAYERAIELLRKSRQVVAGDSIAHSALAELLGKLGETAYALGQPHRARELYNEAKTLQQQLVADHPKMSMYREDLTRTLRRLNQLSVSSGQPTTHESDGSMPD
jgi:tetratricopeptide (TPR) repeat protein